MKHLGGCPYFSCLAARFIPRPLRVIAIILFLLSIPACFNDSNDFFQGYIEGEFLYIASPVGGRLEALCAARGDKVEPGDRLFSLEPEPEKSAAQEAAMLVSQARNKVRDLEKGARTSELDTIRAGLAKARTEAGLARLEYERRKKLARERTISREELDRARTTWKSLEQQVLGIEAELETAGLGARIDAAEAARCELRAAEARLAQAEWRLERKRIKSSRSAVVFDLLHYPGEWVSAASPVMSLLPPENVKVRFFLPEAEVSTLKLGDVVRVFVKNIQEPVAARVDFISPRAEYAPPVIYSSRTRSKLVFMAEARPEPDKARALHPGQPVQVRPSAGPGDE